LEELEQEEAKKLVMLKQKQKEYEVLRKKVEDLQTDLEKTSKAQVGNIDGKLEKLTEKWTKLCQEVLQELQQKATNPTPIGQMLVYFGIEVTFTVVLLSFISLHF
jgi:predicted nuclease with TOPRIM domain